MRLKRGRQGRIFKLHCSRSSVHPLERIFTHVVLPASNCLLLGIISHNATMLLPLPATIAWCLPSIQWPLGPGSSPPMMYEPLEALRNRRSISSSTSSSSPIDGVLSDVAGTVASLTPNGATPDQQQNAALSVALVLLGHGYTDECHDLVTPLSWGDDTPGGPSLRSLARVHR